MYNMLVAARKLDDSIHQIKVATTQLQLLRVYQQVVFFLYAITAYTCDHDQIDTVYIYMFIKHLPNVVLLQ